MSAAADALAEHARGAPLALPRRRGAQPRELHDLSGRAHEPSATSSQDPDTECVILGNPRVLARRAWSPPRAPPGGGRRARPPASSRRRRTVGAVTGRPPAYTSPAGNPAGGAIGHTDAVSAHASPPLETAAENAALIAREVAAETERNRRLPERVLAPLRDAGLLRAGVPALLGGPEADPATTLAAAETVARGDASAGWCVSIAATSSLLSAHLPAAGAEEVFGDPAVVAAGVWAPRGTAIPEDGGFRVGGRWPFCSGIDHSNWLFAGCRTADGLIVAGLPKDDLEILDTWHTAGLRGTGSHDCVATDAWVPAHRTLSLMDGGPVVDAPLYRFPIFGFFALSIAAAALGNARGALDDLATLATTKTTPTGRTLASRPATQGAVAEAEAALRAARGLFFSAIETAWEAARAGENPVSTDLRAGLRLAATHAVRTSADVARAMYDLGGGSAIYETSPLQRRFRDAHTATAHFQVNPATWELTGRLLLGEPVDESQL